MATTLSNFFKHTNAELSGSAYAAALALTAYDAPAALQQENGGNGVRVDVVQSELAAAGFAKNGAFRFTFVTTTPKTVSLLITSTGAAQFAGDVTFAAVNRLIFFNDGAADITIATGASSGFDTGLAGTTPTLTIYAGKKTVLNFATAGQTVDSSHKNIDMTPTSGGSLIVCVGGS